VRAQHQPRHNGQSLRRETCSAHPGSDDLADSGADEPPPLPGSDVEELLLDESFSEALPGSFDDPSFDDPSFEVVFEGALLEAESELVELRESVL
jgi:hypothetical protein